MNSEQIKATPHFDLSVTHWLKEVAYQLALHNEQKAPQPSTVQARIQQRAK